MLKTILVSTDGSDHAGKAVAFASDLAAKYGAELIILHVLLRGHLPEELRRLVEVEGLVEPPPPPPPPTPEIPEAMVITPGGVGAETASLRTLEAVGRQIVNAAERAARECGVASVRTLIEDGDAAERILDVARREDVDAIVLGSRGLGTLKGLLLGSVSHKVAQHAHCICITVK